MKSGLKFLHPTQQPGVERLCVSARMGPPMAVWAESDNKPRIVWAAIAQSANVVRLKVRLAVGANERCIVPAAFASTDGARHNIVAHISAAFNNGALYLSRWRSRVSRSHCARPENIKRLILRRYILNSPNYSLNGAQLKDNRISHLIVAIPCANDAISFTNKLPLKAGPFRNFFEYKKIPTVSNMLAYRSIPLFELHITYTSGAVIFKNSIGTEPIGISVLPAVVARYRDDQLMILEGYNSASNAAAFEAPVNVFLAVVDPPMFEAPSHQHPHSSSNILLDPPGAVEREGLGVTVNFDGIAGTGAGSTAQETTEITFSEEANS